MYGTMYILNFLSMVSFIVWLKQFKDYLEVIDKPLNKKLETNLIDILFSNTYLDHQIISECNQSFSEVGSYDSLINSGKRKKTDLVLKGCLDEQFKDFPDKTSVQTLNCNKIVEDSNET